MARANEGAEEVEKLHRIAIVDADRCKPKNCGLPCKKNCPVNRIGKNCIEVNSTDKVARISEIHCIGCGICAKKCPNNAISIINLSSNLKKHVTHRFGPNSFKLHRLPVPRSGNVLGLIGANGIGKSTALDILAGKIKPNLGSFDNPPDWNQIITNFRGSGLQNYFKKIVEDNLKVIKKPQFISQIFHTAVGDVQSFFKTHSNLDNEDKVCRALDLTELLGREVKSLSGGEIQRFAIALVCVQSADVYMFDEPSSFLDIKQRLKAARIIRSLSNFQNYIIVVEHDLALLDYLSDYVCMFYGVPTAYGVVTLPSSVREGINIFLDGFIPTENLRFRDTSLNFRVSEIKNDIDVGRFGQYKYPKMKKIIGDFELNVDAGEFNDSEIIVMLGENGTGKTTMIKLLAGKLASDENARGDLPSLKVSYKPQTISKNYSGTVRQLIQKRIGEAYILPEFVSDVLKPLQITDIMNLEVENLSGGELQRLYLVLCLGKLEADLYLIDEPSAFLDCEQRLLASKVIKRFILHNKKTAFIVEHDFIMATYLADRVIVFDGQPAKLTSANAPEDLLSGMNKFLRQLEITVRRDRNNYRPRINKFNGVQSKMQSFRADIPELVRTHRKDDEHIESFSKSVNWLVQNVFGPRLWIKWQKEINVLAELSYFAATTLAGLQTLGEEYVGLIQVHGNHPPQVPSLLRRSTFIASQVIGPYLFEKMIIKLKKRVLSESFSNQNSEQTMSIIEKILTFLQRSGLLYVHRIHLAIFYIIGGYYHVSKRLFGIRYLAIRAQSYVDSLKFFKILGYLSMLEIVLSFSFWFYNVYSERMRKKLNVKKVPAKREETASITSSFRCDLCLEFKPPACTQCGHLFCWECLIVQATESKMCPLCRSNIAHSRIVPLLNL